jgi:tetratricopeptide (TPR) repeat protein
VIDGQLIMRRNITQLLCAEGRDKAALEHAKMCVLAEEGNAERHYILGCVHRTLGENLEAAQCFARAVKLDPTFLEAYINNDAVLLKLGASGFQREKRSVKEEGHSGNRCALSGPLCIGKSQEGDVRA